jgi:hypothetical protein
MKIDVNIHINSWRNRKNDIIDPILIQLKNNHERMIVDTDDSIFISFEYPLTQELDMMFTGKKPWRLEDLIDSVCEGYVKIYDEEDETRTLPAQSPLDSILVNRPKTDGKHGIWGHDLNDLYIEGMHKEDGIWHLDIGS